MSPRKLPPRDRRRPVLEELERRLLLSADPQAVLADADLAQDPDAAEPAAKLALLDQAAEASQDAVQTRRELVIIDPGADDAQQLVDDLQRSSSGSRQLDVIVLDAGRDGVSQISEILADHEDLDALHIVSHGSEGAVELGSTWLRADNLDLYASEIASWSDSLTLDADLLFYGCDLAAGDAGEAFVASLAKLTGADVAASDDPTGAAALGGDWTLERSTGAVETAIAFDADARASFAGVLANGAGNTLWISTDADQLPPGADGLPGGWRQGEVLELGGADLTLGDATDGDLSKVIDFDLFTADASDVGALHYVSTAITLGSGGDSFDLLPGDVLVSFHQDETILAAYSETGSDMFVEDQDLLVFRPNSFGDYSSGTFYMLLEDPVPTDFRAVTLVEHSTVVGGTPLAAGTFLMVPESGVQEDIYHLVADGVGFGAKTDVTYTPLIDGSDINLDTNGIRGLELIEQTTTVGGMTLSAGSILVTLRDDDPTVGDNDLPTDRHDIFVLDVTSTGIGTTAATASMLFDASDINMDDVGEVPYALALRIVDPVVSLPGGTWNYTENDPPTVVAPNAQLSDANDANFDGGSLTVDFTSGGTGNDRLAIRDQGPGTGNVTLSGSQVLYDFGSGPIVIGSFSGGTSGSDPLVVTFNVSSDLTSAQAVMRNLTYENVSDDPSGIARIVRMVFDDGNDGTSEPQLQTINVIPQNDAPVVNDQTLGPVAENSTPGTVVGAVAASEVDTGQSLTYAITGGNTGGAFAIDAGTGEITVATTDALDFETTPIFDLTVQVTDDGAPPLNDIATVTINLSDLNDAPVLHAWYDAAWDSRKVVSIDAAQVEGELTDFPVLITLNADPELAASAQVDGDDLLFTAADGTTKLAHEIESYDPVTGALTVWVKIDLSASTDTELFLYYGNAGASNQQDAANVWDANFVGVWHLNDTPTGAAGDIKDSTANANHGTTEGAMDAADSVVARIGKGLDFDEVNDLIRMQDSPTLDSVADEATFEVWVWFDDASDGNHQIIMTSSNRFSDVDGYEWASQGSGNHFFYPDAGLPDTNYNLGSNPFTDQNWHHLAATMDFSTKNVEIYVDGAPMTFTTEGVPSSWSTLTSSDDWLWGGNPDRIERFFDGMMDEIRVSDVVRSQEWIRTSINNQSNPSSFLTVGVAESRDLTLTGVTEDDTSPTGSSILSILSSGFGDRITDMDVGALEGIAVVAADNSNGAWQYTTNGGGTWLAFGSPGTNAARLLAVDANTSVRFVPDPDWNGTVSDGLTFHAWDQTTGSNGATVDLTTSGTGGITAFSTATASSNVTVDPVNDEPSFTTLGDQTVAEDSGAHTVVGFASPAPGGGADEAGQTFSYSVISDNPGLFAVGPAIDPSGTLTYTLAAGTSGTATVTVSVTDSGGTTNGGDETSPDQTFDIIVNPLNAPPLATDDPGVHSTLVSSLSPLSYWRLGETAGSSAADIGSTGNDGTYQGAALGQAGALNGDPDGAVRFDGAEYVEFAHSGDYLIDEGAIQLWFKADATGTDQSLFSKDGLGFVDGGHFSITYKSDGSLEWRLQSDSASFIAASSPVPAGSWHHVLASFGPAGMQLYVDGALADSDPYAGGLGTSSGGSGNSEPFVIGASTQVSGTGTVGPLEAFFTGEIDELAIFGSQLTGEQAQDLYAAALQHYTIAEDGSLVVSAAEGVLANDFDADGDSLTAVLVSGPASAASFTLNPDGSFSYTPTADFNGTDTFTYRADDGTTTSGIATVTITVTGENDAPVVADQTLGPVAENSLVGTVVGTVAASDVDTGQSLSYAITGGNTGGAFAIDAVTGQITVDATAPLDIDTNPVFTLTVQVSDDGTPTLNDTAIVTINLTDVNEAPVVADQTLGPVAENSAVGTVVGTVAASDVDAGQNLSYTITGGNTGGAFAIDAATGEITVDASAPLDFETNPVFTLTVQATDDGTPSLNDTATITINLTDVNDAPVLADQTLGPVAENSAVGTVVGTVAASDVDAGQSLSYVITGGNTGGAFAIDAATGEITVDASAPLDFETNPVFTLTVQVTDDGAPGLAGTATITINLTDVNEAPLIADQTLGPIAENSASGMAVGVVAAADVDAGQSLSYAITAGNTGGAFAIDAGTGAISVATPAVLDFESNPAFTLTVQVTDDGAPGLTDTATVSIGLTDANDAPVVAVQSMSIGEYALDGTSVGSVAASDEDMGDSLTFSITGGNTGGAFAIDPGSGQISVANGNALDSQINPVFALSVQAQDAGGLTHTGTVTIDLEALPDEILDLDPDPDPGDDPNDDPTEDPLLGGEPEPMSEPEEAEPDPPKPEEMAPEPPRPGITLKPSRVPMGDAEVASVTMAERSSRDDGVEASDSAGPSAGEKIREGFRMTALREQAMWDALDTLGDQISDDAERQQAELERTTSRIERVALALSTGLLAVLTRASSLTAMALSSLPVWRRVDPLSVLALSEREKRKREQALREAESLEDRDAGGLGALLDGEPEHEPPESEDEDEKRED